MIEVVVRKWFGSSPCIVAEVRASRVREPLLGVGEIHVRRSVLRTKHDEKLLLLVDGLLRQRRGGALRRQRNHGRAVPGGRPPCRWKWSGSLASPYLAVAAAGFGKGRGVWLI